MASQVNRTPFLSNLAADFDGVRDRALQGDPEAQYEMGMRYRKGNGVAVSNEIAVEWFEKAALQKHAAAEHELGVCYMYGEGVERSLEEAAKRLERALLLGFNSMVGFAAIAMCYGCAVGQAFVQGKYDGKVFLFGEEIDFTLLPRKEVNEDGEANEVGILCSIETLTSLADFYKSLGQYQKALKMYEFAYANQLKEAVNPEIPSKQGAQLLEKMGSCHLALGNFERALELQTKALKGEEQLEGNQTTDFARSLTHLAFSYYALARFQEALDIYHQALEIQIKIGKTDRDIAQTYNGMGLCLRSLGEFKKGLENHLKAHAIEEKEYVDTDPEYTMTLNHIGNCLGALGRFQEALGYHLKALDKRKLHHGAGHHYVASSFNNVGICHYSLGNFDKGLEFFQAALTIRENVYGKQHYHVAGTLNHIANSYAALGRYEDAIQVQEEVLKQRKAIFGEEHPLVASSLNNLSSYYSSQGNYPEALRLSELALNIRRTIFGPAHPETMLSFSCVDSCLIALGKKEKVLRTQSQEENYLSREEFEEIAAFARDYLKGLKEEEIVLKVNPTGFVRLHIPVPEHLLAKNIEVIRLNFWPDGMKIEVVEAPHCHPKYFESMVIHGGYTHSVYQEDKEEGLPFRFHRIFKPFSTESAERSIFCMGTINLNCKGEQTVSKGSIISFPETDVHQVLTSTPLTLTINCVFKSDKEVGYFDVYMPNESHTDPQKDRETVVSDEANKMALQIKDLLMNWNP